MRRICPKCRGQGAVRECDEPEPHKHTSKCGWLLCPKCDGVGTVAVEQEQPRRQEVAA